MRALLACHTQPTRVPFSLCSSRHDYQRRSIWQTQVLSWARRLGRTSKVSCHDPIDPTRVTHMAFLRTSQPNPFARAASILDDQNEKLQ